ncbi:MAG: efflux RND transporter periplasmic adaptor subunit [Cyanobacteria bacterium J06635_1]
MTYQRLQDHHDVQPERPFLREGFINADPASGKPSNIRGLVFGILLGVAFTWGAGQVLSGSSQSLSATTAATIAKNVTVQPPQTAVINQTLTATGTVVASDLLQVTSQLDGLQIQDVRVEEGDTVTKGQVLVVLDDAILQAEMFQAEANLAHARAQVRQEEAGLAQIKVALAEAEDSLRRYQELFDQGAISQEQLTSRRTELMTTRELAQAAIANIESAAANVASKEVDIVRLQRQLAQTQVRAAADGIVTHRQATVGEVATLGTPLLSLIQGDALEVEIKLLQNQLEQVDIGDPVQISSLSGEKVQRHGTVRTIEPIVDAQSRQAIVKVSLSAAPSLRPGMFLKAQIITGEHSGTVIPADAVVFQADDQSVVYTLTPEKTVAAIPIEIGARLPAQDTIPARVEVSSGLDNISQIIVEGATYLQDGDPVNIIEPPSQ